MPLSPRLASCDVGRLVLQSTVPYFCCMSANASGVHAARCSRRHRGEHGDIAGCPSSQRMLAAAAAAGFFGCELLFSAARRCRGGSCCRIDCVAVERPRGVAWRSLPASSAPAAVPTTTGCCGLRRWLRRPCSDLLRSWAPRRRCGGRDVHAGAPRRRRRRAGPRPSTTVMPGRVAGLEVRRGSAPRQAAGCCRRGRRPASRPCACRWHRRRRRVVCGRRAAVPEPAHDLAVGMGELLAARSAGLTLAGRARSSRPAACPCGPPPKSGL